VRKQGANANLALRVGEIVLGLATLLVNDVVGLDGNGGKWIAIIGKFVPEGDVISRVYDQRQNNQRGDNAEEYAFQPFPSLTGA